MRKGIYLLPNLITTASLFCGFLSIIASFKEQFFKAAAAILIAGILDGLDGKIARFTNTTSRFGVEYDSLSDAVAFGIAPALLAYTWSLNTFGRYGWVAAFLYAVCGVLRLARFNVQIGVIDSKVFNGLPIPAAAAVVATSVLIYGYLENGGQFNHPAMLAVMILLAFLMISSVKYYSFKDLNYFTRKPFMTLVLSVLLFLIIIMEPQLVLFVLALSYAVSGPISTIVRTFRKRSIEEQEEASGRGMR